MNDGSQNKNSCGSKMGRCSNCNKKSLVLILCKCALNTCLKCRNPFDHGCPIDYITESKKELEKSNPKISLLKMDYV